jgi:arylsulfatase A-like enzyme
MPADDPHVTLPALLQRRGMYTVAVVDDGYSSMLQAGGGLQHGFDQYVQMPNPTSSGDAATVSRALLMLQERPKDKPFFMWMHLFGPHSPNDVHPEVPRYGDTLADGYDHEIRYMDLQLGRLLGALEQLEPQPVIVLAGDHGELFTSDNRFHGFSVDEAVMRVPLIIRVPRAHGRHIDSVASLVDVLPTILALTRTPGPTAIDGVDLAPTFTSDARDHRVVLTDCWRYAPDRQLIMDLVGGTDAKRFVVYDRLAGTAQSSRAGSLETRTHKRREVATDPLGRIVLGYLDEVGASPL